jgi:hypothetical protein
VANLQTDPQVVISRLANQIGGLAAEIAMRDTQLESAMAEIKRLEEKVVELTPATEETTEKEEVPSGADTSRARGART